MKVLIALAWIVPASGGVVESQEVGSRRTATVEFQAECTLTPEIVDRIVVDLASEDARREANALLEEHEIEHGWCRRFPIGDGLEPDFVDAAHAVRCSDGVLERMAVLRPVREEISVLDLQWPFAIALQRAGRFDQALAMLDAAIASPVDKNDRFAKLSAPSNLSYLNQYAAALCAREGKAERAFEYAKLWKSTSWCGNCAAGEGSRIQTFRVRQLVKLGRNAEVIAIGTEMIQDGWTYPSAALLAMCIDSGINLGNCADASDAASLLRVGGDETRVRRFESGKRLWELQRAPRVVQLASLAEIAQLDEGLAASLVFGFDNPIVDKHLAAFEVVEGRLSQPSLACALARTGNPIVESALERATEALGKQEMDYELSLWKVANARWVALSQSR